MSVIVADNKVFNLRIYPQERSDVDTVGEKPDLFERAINEFGLRVSRGTALGYQSKGNKVYNVEHILREFVKGHTSCVEIGTFRGLSTAILAHYCQKVTTIDIKIFEEAICLWKYFGVRDKIKYCCVDSDASKAQAIEDVGKFDFAFIDGLHTLDAVKVDFELVKKCGTVLFHDYGMPDIPDIKIFVDALPFKEVTIKHPFALWKQQK
jgi:hypothetical protein